MTAAQGASGARRVAAFLLSLDPEAQARVLAHLDDDVVAEVAAAMASLGDDEGDPSRVDSLVRDLALDLNGPKAARACRDDELGKLLERALGPQRGKGVAQRARERRLRDRPFLELEDAPAPALARVLEDESAAVRALVLAHLPPSLAAGVLDELDREAALEVVRRMATLAPPPFPVLREVAGDLVARLAATAEDAAPPDSTARLQTIAELLQRSGPELEKGALETIQEDDAELAAELREQLFTWEDIAGVDRRSMQKILGAVDTKTLSIALKGASAGVEENVLSNLSQRVREMVREERELAGPLPLSEVLAARREVMTAVRALIESGEFRPTRGGDELVE